MADCGRDGWIEFHRLVLTEEEQCVLCEISYTLHKNTAFMIISQDM
jgi:hypothetical protein